MRAPLLGIHLVLWLGSPAAAQVRGDSLIPRALSYIEAAAEEHRIEEGTPGIVVAAVSRDSLLGVRTVGVRDLATRSPLPADGRFLAGSLSKTFTAIALLQLQEEGALDIHLPVRNYLPWFRVESTGGPITLEQLLTHTAGLPRDRSDLPSSPYTALSLGERDEAVPAGARFAYSNIGYQLLSLVIEEVEGRPFAESIRRRIIEPLGLSATAPVVTQGAQLDGVTGYQYLWDDRPPLPGEPLVPVSWGEYDAGDANIVSTAPDLARLLRVLLNQGAGPDRHRLLLPRSFARMVQRMVPATELGRDAFYGYGLVLGVLDGDPVLWHSGGMPGYRSMMLADMDEGVGVVVLMNGPGDPRRLAEYALRVLVAARTNGRLPPVPVASPASQVVDAGSYAGTLSDSTGRRLVLEADGDRLYLVVDHKRLPLLRDGPDQFLTDDPDWRLFPFLIQRTNGRSTEVSYGGQWFVSEDYRGPRQFSYPLAWSRFVGHYRAQVPYFTNYRVVLRRGVLLLISPEGLEQPLIERGKAEFDLGTAQPVIERVRFLNVVSGRALRMNLSGTDYYRTSSP